LKAAIPLFWFPFNSHPFEIRGLQKEEFIRELRERREFSRHASCNFDLPGRWKILEFIRWLR
jgi:hypothetical protein